MQSPRIVWLWLRAWQRLISLLFRWFQRICGRWLQRICGGWLEELELRQALQFCFGLGLSKTGNSYVTLRQEMEWIILLLALSQSKIEGLALVPIPATPRPVTQPPTRRKSKDSSLCQALTKSQTILGLLS